MNANQKGWLKWVGSQSCMVTGDSQIQVHHIWGRKTRANKMNIGHWAIIPLAIRLHDVNSNSPFNITHHRKRFEIEFGTTEKQMFCDLRTLALEHNKCGILEARYIPPPEVAIEIAKYRR